MEWFKHDTDASTDAKIRKLIMRHGAVGYAVYFHCLELIMADVNKNNITFQLEHDAEIIADNLKISGTGMEAGVDIVNKIMITIIELKLFESNSNRITCVKLLSRLDSSMTSNSEFRKQLKATKTALLANHHDTIMTTSCLNHDTIMQEEEQEAEENRIRKELEEEKNTKKETSNFDRPVYENYPSNVSSNSVVKDEPTNIVMIPKNISQELHTKFVEFLEYKELIKSPIKTSRPFTDLIEKIGKEYANEIHLIQCISMTMAKEWKHVRPEYVEYKHVTNPDTFNERKRANENPGDYEPVGSLVSELAKKVTQ